MSCPQGYARAAKTHINLSNAVPNLKCVFISRIEPQRSEVFPFEASPNRKCVKKFAKWDGEREAVHGTGNGGALCGLT